MKRLVLSTLLAAVMAFSILTTTVKAYTEVAGIFYVYQFGDLPWYIQWWYDPIYYGYMLWDSASGPSRDANYWCSQHGYDHALGEMTVREIRPFYEAGWAGAYVIVAQAPCE